MAVGRAGVAGRVGRWAVRLAWAAGWVLAQQAAVDSVIFEPTDEALRAYEQSAPYGLAGGAVMLAAALARFAYRGWLSALWFALMPVVTLALLAREERGDPLLWQLLCLLAAVGLLAWDLTAGRRAAAALAP